MKKTVTLYIDAELYEFVKKKFGSPSRFFEEAARNLKSKNRLAERVTCNHQVAGSNPAGGLLSERVIWTKEDVEAILTEMKLNNRNIKHIKNTRRRLLRFSEWCSYSCNLNDIIIYLDKIKKQYSFSEYYQTVLFIRKLMKEIKAPFADKIKLPKKPKRRERVIKKQHVSKLLAMITNLPELMALRGKAAVLLAATSGLRAEEVYKLKINNIDIDGRTLYLQADIVKDYEDRITFFSEEARAALIAYLQANKSKSKYLFPESNMKRIFSRLDTSLRLKHMRKFFSQQSDRLGMPTAVKRMLMGHSLRGDIDLQHYDFQDEEELKKIYDRYWKDFKILE